MIAPQMRPSPSSRRSRWTNGTRPRSTLSPSLESSAGNTVSEPSIATATTVIVATPKDAKLGVAGEEHPRHGDHHGQPGDEDRAARRRCCGLECGLFATTGGALLTLALQIEHRVVDADREPDQEDDRRDGVGHRQHLADERDEAERGEHRR